MTFDPKRIATSVPINQTARNVTEADGEHWEPTVNATDLYDVAPPTYPIPPAAQKLVGLRVNRLTVIGYGGRNPKRGSRWVCRCDCGRYTIRNTRGLLDPSSTGEMMCPRCRHLERVKWRYENLPPRDFTGRSKA